MPDEKTLERAREDEREGKSPSTQAGEFVREEIHHVREGKHGARSPQQAIAIGLSKARRAGVKLAPPKKGPSSVRKKAEQDVKAGKARHTPSAKRSRAVSGEAQARIPPLDKSPGAFPAGEGIPSEARKTESPASGAEGSANTTGCVEASGFSSTIGSANPQAGFAGPNLCGYFSNLAGQSDFILNKPGRDMEKSSESGFATGSVLLAVLPFQIPGLPHTCAAAGQTEARSSASTRRAYAPDGSCASDTHIVR